MQLRVVRGHADHVKPHQLGSALNEWRIVLGKARCMRLAVDIDAEDHENRYFFGHAEDLPFNQFARANTGERKWRHCEHNRNKKLPQLIFYAGDRSPIDVKIRVKTCAYAALSGTRAQLSNTGQSVCWHGARSSMR